MPSNRRYIHPAQKELMITMSQSTRMTPKDIARVTNYSERTVQRVIRLWKETGLVERRPTNPGRPRELDTADVMVSYSAIETLSFLTEAL
jgi:transposase